jgi:hypothetical protein
MEMLLFACLFSTGVLENVDKAQTKIRMRKDNVAGTCKTNIETRSS